MAGPNHIAVIDIGKTNAKVVLFDVRAGAEIAVRKRPNQPLAGAYSHYDVEALWSFFCQALGEIEKDHGIDAISITTHGACFALLAEDGTLALPVMDYEDTQPDGFDADYRAIRPPFAETGSPRLPMGLNAAAMLYWQMKRFPTEFAHTRWILPWPQYWAFRLTGEVATEATSLGVHTDLWNPHKGAYSSLVERMGWTRLMPVLKPANAVLGTVRQGLAERIGLKPGIPVHSGLHDSNASLLPHLYARKEPFSVLSTGTWVVALSVGGRDQPLDESRDVLINVNGFGQKTPSARFMGGRAFELLAPKGKVTVTDADRAAVLSDRVMVLPSFPEGSGPFPHAHGRWTVEPRTDGERLYAVSLYLALMSQVTRELIGAEGDVVVEGPFAANSDYLDMLASLAGRRPVVAEGRMTGTSFGAACLALASGDLPLDGTQGEAVTPGARHLAYARHWHSLAGT